VTAGVYGKLPAELAQVDADALQFSPLMPGAHALEHQSEGSLASFAMLAPPGTLERRYAMALALRAVAPGGAFTVLAPKDRGGTRLRKEMEAFGCPVEETARRHHRIATTRRPSTLAGIDEALAAGGPRLIAETGLWSQPGVFSWDRLDPGSAMLLQHLPVLSGRGADFGCGLGILSRAVLASPSVTHMTLIDIDRRAVESAQRNVSDARAHFVWGDARDASSDLARLDFVVMNAPFHDAGAEDKSLAQDFVRGAAEALRKDGVCWLVANRHLPYETIMQPLFKRVRLVIETGGYKIYEAHK
jgi:16S rRNA (guanine1207-N2)-methyltransferase